MKPDDRLPGGLPPRPDADTGEPFPPHAPVYEGLGSKDKNNSDELDHGKPPTAPPGQGPPLSWSRKSRRSAVGVFAFYFISFIILGTIYSAFTQNHPIGWAGTWWMWLILFALSLPAALTVKGERCSAGADWLRYRKDWVHIYELETIQAKPSASGLWLDLRDAHGRGLEATLVSLQYNRRVWDLLYNGMLHSAANGATVNRAAQRAFRLPSGSE